MLNMRTFLLKSVYIVVVMINACESQDMLEKMRKPCRYDVDCAENAYCKDQSYCLCKEAFIPFLNGSDIALCLKEATNLDDSCIEDIQCTKPFGNHANCSVTSRGFKACNCMPGAHFKEGRCYETSKIGEKCIVSNNCYLVSGLPAYCDKSICECPNNHHATADGTDCIKSSNLDEPCMSDQECIAQNSRCSEVCRCKVNYIQSQTKNDCLKAADNMGDPCEEKEQCTMFLDKAMCGEDGLCKCLPGFHYTPPQSKCYRNIMLGEMCEENTECIAPSSECKSGICQCIGGYDVGQNKTSCVSRNKGTKEQFGNTYICLLLCLSFLLRR